MFSVDMSTIQDYTKQQGHKVLYIRMVCVEKHLKIFCSTSVLLHFSNVVSFNRLHCYWDSSSNYSSATVQRYSGKEQDCHLLANDHFDLSHSGPCF